LRGSFPKDAHVSISSACVWMHYKKRISLWGTFQQELHVFLHMCLYPYVCIHVSSIQRGQCNKLNDICSMQCILQHPATPCTLQHPATHFNTLQHLLYAVHPATPCNTLQHPATPYNTLQHTTTQRIPQRHLLYAVHPATPCNSLQHPATPCNTLQHTTTQRIPPRHLLNVDLRRRPLFEKIPKKTGAPKKTFAAHPYTYAGYRHVWIFGECFFLKRPQKDRSPKKDFRSASIHMYWINMCLYNCLA